MRLVLQVDAKRALLNHFVEWHSVLSRGPAFPPWPGETAEEEWRRIEPLIDDFYDRRDAADAGERQVSEWPDALRTEIESS